MEEIRIRGARTHNLKNINLDLPRNKLIVIIPCTQRGSGATSNLCRLTLVSSCS
jgi:excinuclease ABC subunit A